MPSNPLILLPLLSIVAAIPGIIWMFILFKKTKEKKTTIMLIFGLGLLTAPALILLQKLWDKVPIWCTNYPWIVSHNLCPQIDLVDAIQGVVETQSLLFLSLFLLFGALEEIIKHYVISTVDKKTTLIKTINDTIRYSFVAALGFAVSENVFYLYKDWAMLSQNKGALIELYILRSTLTAAAHMIFSGIFGYYYAMGKFSIYITKQKRLTGDISKTEKLISKIFKIPLSQAYQQKMVLKGLIIAITAHVSYNFLLQYNYKFPVIIFVVLAFLFLNYLLKRKAGHLIINTDLSKKRSSTIAKKDSDVIVELLGMWFKEKRYVDVMHICERLLERDPDNKIVKLFKAKAMDKMDDQDTYKSILESMLKSKDEMPEKDKNTLSKYISEKEMFEKVKKMIKKAIEKQGKKYIEYKTPAQIKLENQAKKQKKPEKTNKKNLLDDLSKGESFKM